MPHGSERVEVGHTEQQEVVEHPAQDEARVELYPGYGKANCVVIHSHCEIVRVNADDGNSERAQGGEKDVVVLVIKVVS